MSIYHVPAAPPFTTFSSPMTMIPPLPPQLPLSPLPLPLELLLPQLLMGITDQSVVVLPVGWRNSASPSWDHSGCHSCNCCCPALHGSLSCTDLRKATNYRRCLGSELAEHEVQCGQFNSRTGTGRCRERADQSRRIVYMSVGGDGTGGEAEDGDGGTITIRRGIRSWDGCDCGCGCGCDGE